MEKEEFEKILNQYAKEISIELTDQQINKFYSYMNLLLEWNEKINLTAITDYEEIILKHFIDSLTISKYIEENKILIDVGTGAGFPGIPLKIIRDDIKVTLLDSLKKRINFLEEVIKILELKNIEAVHGRCEEFGRDKKYRETFDIATSRAVANLATLSEYTLPLVKQNGICICMKGSDVDGEVKNGKKAISVLGGKIENIEKFVLPMSDINRSVVMIKKVALTPVKFPRKPGTPSKEPIV